MHSPVFRQTVVQPVKVRLHFLPRFLWAFSCLPQEFCELICLQMQTSQPRWFSGRHTGTMHWCISWQDLSDLLALFAVCREKHCSIVFNENQNKATLQAHPTFWLCCLYPLVGFWTSVLVNSSFYTANEKQNVPAHMFCMPAFEVVMLHPLHSRWREMHATRQGSLWPF